MSWIKRLLGQEAVSPIEATHIPAPAAPVTPRAYTRYDFTNSEVVIAAIGDLHGRIDLLRPVAARLDELAQTSPKRLIEVYVGDYVDRGGSGRAVLDFLLERKRLSDRKVICLAGNHEQMMLAALEDDKSFLSWLAFGGDSTLASYGVSPLYASRHPSQRRKAFRDALPAEHFEFLKSLDLFYRDGGFFFVHAGVLPGTPLDRQQPRDLLWIRDRFLKSAEDFGEIIVHGHTPTDKPVFRPNRIGIDTGAYLSGRLTCLLISSEQVSVLHHTAD